jgi:hypothetical protein
LSRLDSRVWPSLFVTHIMHAPLHLFFHPGWCHHHHSASNAHVRLNGHLHDYPCPSLLWHDVRAARYSARHLLLPIPILFRGLAASAGTTPYGIGSASCARLDGHRWVSICSCGGDAQDIAGYGRSHEWLPHLRNYFLPFSFVRRGLLKAAVMSVKPFFSSTCFILLFCYCSRKGQPAEIPNL